MLNRGNSANKQEHDFAETEITGSVVIKSYLG